MKNTATSYLNTQIETLLTNATVAHVEQRTDDRDSRIADALELIEAVGILENTPDPTDWSGYNEWVESIRAAATPLKEDFEKWSGMTEAEVDKMVGSFTTPLPADPLRGDGHQSDGTVRPADPKEYRPLTFEDTIQEGDEVWQFNKGPWAPVTPTEYGQNYRRGYYAMRRPIPHIIETPTKETFMPEAKAALKSCISMEDAERYIAAWMDTAAQFSRNEEFYHGIVTQIGNLFGEVARTSDDGIVQDSVLALKVPELVKRTLLNQQETVADNRRLREERFAYGQFTTDVAQALGMGTMEISFSEVIEAVEQLRDKNEKLTRCLANDQAAPRTACDTNCKLQDEIDKLQRKYRDLVVGEVIQKGDEMFEYNKGPWSPVLRNNIGRSYHTGHVKIRRPIHLDTAPAAAQTPGA